MPAWLIFSFGVLYLLTLCPLLSFHVLDYLSVLNYPYVYLSVLSYSLTSSPFRVSFFYLLSFLTICPLLIICPVQSICPFLLSSLLSICSLSPQSWLSVLYCTRPHQFLHNSALENPMIQSFSRHAAIYLSIDSFVIYIFYRNLFNHLLAVLGTVCTIHTDFYYLCDLSYLSKNVHISYYIYICPLSAIWSLSVMCPAIYYRICYHISIYCYSILSYPSILLSFRRLHIYLSSVYPLLSIYPDPSVYHLLSIYPDLLWYFRLSSALYICSLSYPDLSVYPLLSICPDLSWSVHLSSTLYLSWSGNPLLSIYPDLLVNSLLPILPDISV